MASGFGCATEYLNSMGDVWDYLSSGYALLIYALIIIVLVGLLIASVLIADNKSKIIIDKNPNAPQERDALDGKDKLDDSDKKSKDERAAKPKKSKNSAPEKANNGERFPTLIKIDREKEKYERSDYDESITLKTLCENLRNYAANQEL